jgi:hypothetical protein
VLLYFVPTMRMVGDPANASGHMGHKDHSSVTAGYQCERVLSRTLRIYSPTLERPIQQLIRPDIEAGELAVEPRD